ncbi:ATP-binding protein [Fervidibacter sacchari]|uniref:ATPase n=1 Tax=Candidatus Fervidibacter sacchari TaxID=1448929 RepID=A0ABT2ESK8_9BACT|nr:ATP-binding protein [Candidatus Fervidibacter sacchari]MCS3920912.1 putative ATPase [Candidatus Fervidibacter sacchari]WKU14862.1 ATP-binding protein [Candidatus Fervidibacter sacchari]
MIVQVEAYNYRCLKVIKQPLDRFHVLIGRNGSGKSAFLDVLMLLSDALLSPNLDIVVFGAGEDGLVSRTEGDFRDLLHKGEGKSFTLAIVAALPSDLMEEKGLGRFDRCRYQVRIGVDEEGEFGVLSERLWLIEGKSPHDFEFSVQQWLFEPSIEELQETLFQHRTPEGWKLVIRREGEQARYWSEVGKWNYPLTVSPKRLALSLADEERLPASAWLMQFLRDEVFMLQLNPRLMRKPCPATANDAFNSDGANLPKVVLRLQKEEPRLFRQWLEHVRSEIKGLKDIEVRRREEDNALYLVLHYDGVAVKQWSVSEGTLRFLALTLLGYLPEERGVWLIEEPENGIHPQALEAVVEALATAQNIQVLMATHSPTILDCRDYIEPSNLLCFRLENGATVIETAEDLMRRWETKTAALTLGDLMAWGVL